MLKYKEIKDIDDYYNPEDIVLLKYLKFENDKVKQINNVVLDSLEVLESICNLGKEILNVFISEYSVRYVIKNNLDLDNIVEYLEQEREKVNHIIYKWILENGFPYINNDNDDINLLIWDSLICYIFKELHKHSINFNNYVKSSKINRKDNPKYKISFYVSIIRNILIFTLQNAHNQRYVGECTKELMNEDDIINIIKELKGRKISSYDLFMDKDTLKLFDMGMITYILLHIDELKRKDNFKLTRQIPIYNKHANEIRFYNTATSLIGIAYNRLLINLTTTKYGYVRVECANPDCNNVFVKNGKNMFCQKCIDSGIARKIIYRNYNAKRKASHND